LKEGDFRKQEHMKKVFLALTLVSLFIVGCKSPSQPAQNHKLQIEVNPPQVSPPPTPVVPPPPYVPPIYSPHFMYGYSDGYYLRWTNWRWWLSPDYRYGYDLGRYDRTYNIHRFNP
jgi:hypothetical protein